MEGKAKGLCYINSNFCHYISAQDGLCEMNQFSVNESVYNRGMQIN
jgi:hypothetical protein